MIVKSHRNVHMILNKILQLLESQKTLEYTGRHTAPTNDGETAPLYDVSLLYPESIYTPNGYKLFPSRLGTSMDKASWGIILKARNKPDYQLTVYRAVPILKDGKELTINDGDWVTINKQFAIDHGKSVLKGNYKILEKNVTAKDLYTEANSIHEWGYDPQ